MEKTNAFLSATVSAIFFAIACSDDASSGSASNGGSDSASDTGADSESSGPAEAGCVDLGAYLVGQCDIPDAQAAQLIAGCAVMTGSLSSEAIGPLLGCLVAEDCTVWSDQAQSMAAFMTCSGDVAADLPPSTAAQEFVETSCGYQTVCAGSDSVPCADGAVGDGAALVAILDESVLEGMTGCVPASPDCSAAEQEGVTSCIQALLPISMLGQLQP